MFAPHGSLPYVGSKMIGHCQADAGLRLHHVHRDVAFPPFPPVIGCE